MVEHKDNTFGFKIPHLITVCWFDPWVIADNVKPGVYDVYLLHGVENKRTVMVGQAKMFIECQSYDESNDVRDELFVDESFMS